MKGKWRMKKKKEKNGQRLLYTYLLSHSNNSRKEKKSNENCIKRENGFAAAAAGEMRWYMMYEDWMKRFLWHVFPFVTTYTFIHSSKTVETKLMVKQCDGKFIYFCVG